MNKNQLWKRYFLLLIGLFAVALGVAFSVKANLGIAPLSCVPYVLGEGTRWTMGQYTIALNVIFLLLQIALLRKEFEIIQLLQLPLAIIFGVFTDFTLWLVRGMEVSNYFQQWGLCLLSCVILAVGVYFEVKANVIFLATEGAMLAITKVFDKEFGKVKIAFDCSQVILGMILSLILFQQIKGVREGTIAGAFLVGMIVRYFSQHLKVIDHLLGEDTVMEQESMQPVREEAPFTVTIGREYGSGGHDIGALVSQKLEVAFYDQNLIELQAKESGFTTEFVQKNEQKLTNSLLYDLYMGSFAYMQNEVQAADGLFLAQSKILKQIARKESSVIVGRLGNYILKEQPNCFHVFINADEEYCSNRIMEKENLSRKEASKKYREKSVERRNYYRYFTKEEWGRANSFHLSINSSCYQDQETADLIIEAFQKFRKARMA